MPTEARDLKSTIIDTDNNKNNLKQAKENIDNKLTELGGKKSVNLFGVPIKIEEMIKNEYEKIAILNIDKEIMQSGDRNPKYIEFNVNFVPKYAFAEVHTLHPYVHCNVITSNIFGATVSSSDGRFFSSVISDLSKNGCKISQDSGHGLKIGNLYLIG